MQKTSTSELLSKLNEYFNVYNKLNNITYHNLQKTKKLIQEISKQINVDSELTKDIKIHLYTLQLTLEEIDEIINKHLKENE